MNPYSKLPQFQRMIVSIVFPIVHFMVYSCILLKSFKQFKQEYHRYSQTNLEYHHFFLMGNSTINISTWPCSIGISRGSSQRPRRRFHTRKRHWLPGGKALDEVLGRLEEGQQYKRNECSLSISMYGCMYVCMDVCMDVWMYVCRWRHVDVYPCVFVTMGWVGVGVGWGMLTFPGNCVLTLMLRYACGWCGVGHVNAWGWLRGVGHVNVPWQLPSR